jgi:hypothetical protein
MKKFIIVVALLSLAGCAHHYIDVADDDPYGFFSGIWHGIVFPFSLVANVISWLVSLFGFQLWQSIEIIGRPNTGFFYYVGFFFGLSAAAGSGNSR